MYYMNHGRSLRSYDPQTVPTCDRQDPLHENRTGRGRTYRYVPPAGAGGDRGGGMSGYDLVSMGRTGVDIYPLDHGVGLEDVEDVREVPGRQRHQRRRRRGPLRTSVPPWSPAPGDDPFGRYVRQESERLGVDPAFISAGDGPPTPVTFCEVFPPDDFPLYFYRYPTAPDLQLDADDVPRLRSGTPGPLGDRHRAVAGALPVQPLRGLGARGPPSPHRPRPRLPADVLGRPGRGDRPRWPRRSRTSRSPSATGRSARSPWARPSRSAPPTRCSTRGLELAVVKQGPKGVLAATADERVEVPPLPGRGGQRARRGRRLRRRPGARPAVGLGPAPHPRVRERRRRPRRRAGSSAPPRCPTRPRSSRPSPAVQPETEHMKAPCWT